MRRNRAKTLRFYAVAYDKGTLPLKIRSFLVLLAFDVPN